MYEFWEYVKSQPTHFLILALILGLVGSWLGVYPIRGIDWVFGKLSRQWGERAQVKAAARKQEIERLRANPHEQVMTAIEAIDDKLQGVGYVALGLLAGMLGQLALMKWLQWAGIFCVLVGYASLMTCWRKLSLTRQARR